MKEAIGRTAVGYIRVSTDEQARSGLGLEAQEQRIRAYATMAGLELVAIIRDEGVSGAVPIEARPGGSKLRAELRGRNRTAAHVVALKLDRLFRDAADCLNQTKAWDKAGVALHLLDMGGQAINTASAMGRMFLTMAAGFAELERNLTCERTTAAMAVKRGKGEKTGGSVPYGFRLAADGRTLEQNPAEQRIMTRVKALRADGYSYRGIAAALNQARQRTKEGSAWTHKQVTRVLANAERFAACSAG